MDSNSKSNSDTKPNGTSRFFSRTSLKDPAVEKSSITQLLEISDTSQAHLIFPVAHDDDAAIGSGRLIKLATEMGIKSSIIITTDGRNGYEKAEYAANIIETRRQETIYAYGKLGISETDICFLNYPDLGLTPHIGRRQVETNSDPAIQYQQHNHTGLMNSYAWAIRRLSPRPTHVFIPTNLDPHPDHQVVWQQALFTCGWLGIENVWSEIPGGNWATPPRIFEYPVYRLPDPSTNWCPSHVIECSKELTDDLADVIITGWKSQGQIFDLAEHIKANRTIEWFREYVRRGVEESYYKNLFFK